MSQSKYRRPPSKTALKCVLCKEDFGHQSSYNQHIQSQGHALRQLANQLETDRRDLLYLQSQLSNLSISASHGDPSGKPEHCIPCKKSFKDSAALNQHQRDSPKHKSAVLPLRSALTDQDQITPQRSSTQKPSTQKSSTQKSSTQKSSTQKPSTQSQRQFRPVQVDFIAPNTRKPHSTSQEEKKSIAQNSAWPSLSDYEGEGRFRELSHHCHSPEDLVKNNYKLSPYSAEEIAQLRRCKACRGVAITCQNKPCYYHPGKPITTTPSGNRVFSCCQTANRGCFTCTHVFPPVQSATKFLTYAHSPTALPQMPKSYAIVLDCEMVGVREPSGLAQNVIQVCAIDYLTGAVLVNKLVQPEGRVRDWRTEIHGVTGAMMENAVSQGHALAGWSAARAELWKLIDENTILIGHALHHDLDALRMLHTRIVDSAILARNAVGMSRQWGLQRLCEDLLGVEIRKSKGGVHDCVEDVFATREVVLWCLKNKLGLDSWAKVQKEKITQEMEMRKAAQLAKAKRIAEEKIKMAELDILLGVEYE